jgi:hypothetical protein
MAEALHEPMVGGTVVERRIHAPDPGPMARLREVVADPQTMGVLVQRLSDGETLKSIAKGWQIPYGKLAEWLIEDRERSERYNAALKIWADSLAQESVGIADDGGTEAGEVQRDKLRIDTRLKLAGKWNRDRYGDATEVKHTGSVSLLAILSSMPRGNVIEQDATPPAVEVLPEKNSEKSAEGPI